MASRPPSVGWGLPGHVVPQDTGRWEAAFHVWAGKAGETAGRVTAACAFTAMPAGDLSPQSRVLGVLNVLGWGLEGFLLCGDFDSCGQRLLWRGGAHNLFQPSESASTPNPGASEGPRGT